MKNLKYTKEEVPSIKIGCKSYNFRFIYKGMETDVFININETNPDGIYEAIVLMKVKEGKFGIERKISKYVYDDIDTCLNFLAGDCFDAYKKQNTPNKLNLHNSNQ